MYTIFIYATKTFFFFGKKHILRLFRRETQTPAIAVRIEQ